MKKRSWEPPGIVSREQVIKDTEEVLAMPDIPIKQTEDIFRIHALGMEWDIGAMISEPEDPGRISMGADGKKPVSFCSMADREILSSWSAWPSCWLGSLVTGF